MQRKKVIDGCQYIWPSPYWGLLASWQTAAAASRIEAAEQLRCGGAILYFLQQEWNFIIEKKTLHPSFPELIISPGSGLNLLSTSKEMMKKEDKILQKGH